MARLKEEMNNLYDGVDDEERKRGKTKSILIYSHNPELYITRDPLCYILTNRSKDTFYPSLHGAFTALSNALLNDHFGKIPDEEKKDIKRILKAIEEHDKMIKEMFKGY